MIPVPSGVRVWLAVGHTDMRRGMNSLAIQVQQGLQRDPHAGDLYVFRGKRGHLVKILWHDGIGMSLYAKRLERGRFIWPSPAKPAPAKAGGRWRSPQLNWPTCLRALTGAIRCAAGGRGPPAEAAAV
ncbi:MAG: IS66 family insertion sequence element accessory protein TnpB [Stellaceae bacterium]